MDKFYKNEKGMALPIVVIVFSIMIILGISLIDTTDSEVKVNKADEVSKKALQYAEAGYNAYLWHLNDDMNFYNIDINNIENKDTLDKETSKLLKGEPIEIQDGYYKVEVEKPSDRDRYVKIISTGWTKEKPSVKRRIVAKIRKKQFTHHAYVSNDDGPNIWWTSGEQCHGPYHTNGVFKAEERTRRSHVNYPIFYDTVTYAEGKRDEISRRNRDKAYKMGEPKKVEPLIFPKNNSELKKWAEKDNSKRNGGMVFSGRTCIYLDGDKVKIRNGNSTETREYSISKDIRHGVIYVEGRRRDREYSNFYEKFSLDDANVFVCGTLRGKLTIAAENNIYITSTDPTNWSRPDNISIPQKGGIQYYGTKFNGKKDGTGIGSEEMSAFDEKKGIYTRYAMKNNKLGADGKDMLGLVANNDIMIMHYGWLKQQDENIWYDQPYWYGMVNYYYYPVPVPYKKDMAADYVDIHAAVFAINGGFGFENAFEGNEKKYITLWGSITQKTRKPVGQLDSYWYGYSYEHGYNKKYAHDPRMFYDYPPHFLEPTNVGWELIEWKEVNQNMVEGGN